jgi:tRNA modification GTPase
LTIDASLGWTTADQEIYTQVKNRPLILVINKTDLAPSPSLIYPPEISQVVKTSAANHQGINDLETAIVALVSQGAIFAANSAVAVNQRQASALTRAKVALEQLQETITNQLPLDFWTIDLRGAIQALGEITGEEVTESILDRIFSRFCIGK